MKYNASEPTPPQEKPTDSRATGLQNDLTNDSRYKSLVEQIDAEYKVAKQHLDPKLQIWRKRLKLMNNQRKDEAAVGDVTLFTQFQTLLAAFYDDQLAVTFKGKNEGDVDTGENLTLLADQDSKTMHKSEFDYFKLWNTLFFGRSVTYFTNFDREKDNTPIPELANMLTFLRDPDAVSINGDVNGNNAARFFGREIKKSKQQMTDHPDFFDVDQLKPGYQKTDDLITQANQALEEAQGLTVNSQADEEKFGANAQYRLLEWCTHWLDPEDKKVKKVLCVLGNGGSKVVRMHIFEEDHKLAKTWPVGDMPLYPSANDWDGVSLPDIVEDKQRMRAVLNNLAIKGVKAALYPSFIYDRKRFKNRADFNLDVNKFIPVENGDPRTAIAPMQRASLDLTFYNQIMQSLALSAQQATATPEMQQGRLNEQNRTATELAMVQQSVGTRYSLTAKVFGWFEVWFWTRWYRMYKDNLTEKIDEKVLRLEGAFGPRFRKFTRENIIADVDPDVDIESRTVADAKTRQQKQDFLAYMNIIAMYPGTNLRYGLQRLGRMTGMHKDELDRLFPPTIDEMIAEDENKMLSQDKIVYVNTNDNHEMHLEIHAKAAETHATLNHIEAHRKAMEMKRDNPALFAQPQQQQQQQPGQPAQPGQPGQGQQPPPNPFQSMMDANKPQASYMQ